MPLKVLYVDDQKDLCNAFMKIFSSAMINVRTAYDGPSALKAIADDEPHLIFLDHHMGSTTGSQLAKHIKPHIPLVSVSGTTQLDPGPRFFRVVGKPFRKQDITTIFESVLAGKAIPHYIR